MLKNPKSIILKAFFPNKYNALVKYVVNDMMK